MAYPRRLRKPAAKKATTPRSSTRTKAAVTALRKRRAKTMEKAQTKRAALLKRVEPMYKKAQAKRAALRKMAESKKVAPRSTDAQKAKRLSEFLAKQAKTKADIKKRTDPKKPAAPKRAAPKRNTLLGRWAPTTYRPSAWQRRLKKKGA